MEIVTVLLTRVITKLAGLLVGEYNLQKEVKGGIIFLQAELESIRGALEKISNIPADELDVQDKIWARAVRELSYDIEDKVDTFMVHCKGSRQGKHGFKKLVDGCLDLLMQPKIRRMIATDIRDIKSRVEEVGKRRDRYKVNNKDVRKAVKVDPRLFARYENVVDLVGIDEARDEVINILGEDNEGSKKQDKIVSIVGFGGLGKTTLANVVYEKLRSTFDCSAFVSVSQTPNMDRLFKDMLFQFSKKTSARMNVIDDLREFLDKKRYLVVVDDIWDNTTWKMIRCGLPGDNVGCKIIITTRILSVAEHIGNTYKKNPLCPQNSKKLLYRRIFGNEKRDSNEDPEECPPKELAEVSEKIIKKCAGVPLAIITIASLLANKGRSKMEWYEVYNSIGTGMENSFNVENMRKILSYSYYDLPSHLRTSLLYVSMFPEDYEIQKDRLIWLWIAEGFVEPRKQGKSLYNLGENYFNELINRSMIHPLFDHYGIEVIGCYVHDMVLDLIRSISSEESFAAILSSIDNRSSSTMARRLSLQNGNTYGVMAKTTTSMPQVRSIVSCSIALDQMSALQKFKVLRVLDLRSCAIAQGRSLKYLGSLFHLRYLSLKYARIVGEIPEEIGNLQFLETLDVEGVHTGLSRLPSTVVQLTCLLCLSMDWNTQVPKGVGSLLSLEELSWLRIDEEWADTIIKSLGLLKELRLLHISLHKSDKWADKLAESLGKLQRIQNLHIKCNYRSMGVMDDWVAPRQLRRLETREFCWFSALPVLINNPLHFQDLSDLSIALREFKQEDLEILGRLPALRSLELDVNHQGVEMPGRFVIGADSFQRLVCCEWHGFEVPMVFQQGAMPRVSSLGFKFDVMTEIAGSDGYVLGLGNLLSLQKVFIWFAAAGATWEELQEAEAALRHAVEIHPNRPILEGCDSNDDDHIWPARMMHDRQMGKLMIDRGLTKLIKKRFVPCSFF